MSEINLYKINNIQKLREKLIDKEFKKKNGTKKIEIENNEIKEKFHMTFYYHQDSEEKELPWKNFAEKFNFTPPNLHSRPNAIILIENDGNYYGISFGTAYHYIDPFSNKEWAFEFAKRIDYSKVNLIATTIPQSKLNKQISTYINYNNTQINTGEALNKIAAYISTEDEFEDFNNKIQAGTSIKINLKKDNLETIAKTISYVEKIVATEEIHHEFPAMKEIKDEDRINSLNKILLKEFEKIIDDPKSNTSIDINQYINFSTDILEIDEFKKFELISKENKKILNELNMNEIVDFIKSNEIDSNNILNIVIKLENENQLKRTLQKIIIFDCIDENCIYENGKWKEYNEDYINMVEESIKTIPAEYCPEYSFYSEDYENYLSERKNCEPKDYESFFTETTFNEYLGERHGYEYYDKKLKRTNNYPIELMDLYKDKTAYSVKKGNSASKLSYVVDQCISGLEYIRNGKCDFDKEIETVCIWLILERETVIHDENTNKVDLNKLKMMILKNKLIEWKKQMLLWNYKPLIRINYKKSKEK